MLYQGHSTIDVSSSSSHDVSILIAFRLRAISSSTRISVINLFNVNDQYYTESILKVRDSAVPH